MIPQSPCICPYTTNSLRFFLLCPIFAIGRSFQVPVIITFALFLLIPRALLGALIKFARNHIILVNHRPVPNHPHSIQVSIGVVFRSTLLGLALSVGYKLTICDQPYLKLLGTYIVLLSVFHFGEYFVTSLTSPRTLRPESFLLYHSMAYVFATSTSLTEFFLESYYFPNSKRFNLISVCGLTLCIFGEIIRKLAMFTAGQNFSHTIMYEKRPDHFLVTHGLYSIFRHPSYAGWFYWAIGTQILLLNPVCFLLFTVMSHKFFKERISNEEETLIDFFGDEYKNYRMRVKLWMPIGRPCSSNSLRDTKNQSLGTK